MGASATKGISRGAVVVKQKHIRLKAAKKKTKD